MGVVQPPSAKARVFDARVTPAITAMALLWSAKVFPKAAQTDRARTSCTGDDRKIGFHESGALTNKNDRTY